MCKFYPLEVEGCGSETQRQMGEIFNNITNTLLNLRN